MHPWRYYLREDILELLLWKVIEAQFKPSKTNRRNYQMANGVATWPYTCLVKGEKQRP